MALPDCIEHDGYRMPKGYGTVGRHTLAHRVAWIKAHGFIPKGLCVLHRCDNPPCVNPEHLFLGTRADNNRDRHQKGRSVGGSMPGEGNPNAKLTRWQVGLIRDLYAGGGISQAKLGFMFSVSQATVSHVARGESWCGTV